MKKKIFFLNARVNDRNHNQYKDLILELLKKHEVYILNIYNLKLFEKKIKYKTIKIKKNFKNLKIVNINNTKELKDYLKYDKSIFVLNSITRGLQDFKIYYYLKKFNCFTIFIDNVGHYGGRIAYDTSLRYFLVSFPHLFEKGFYYIWRILTILNIFPKINILFLSDISRKKIFLNGLSNKFESLFPFLKIFLYRRIIEVNSESYDQYLKLKKLKTKRKTKFILFADSPIDHFDRVSREGNVLKSTIKKFYNNLFIYFKKIEKATKLNIIFTIHPNEKHNIFKLNLLKKNNIKFYNGSTSNLIGNCEYFIFTHSSAIVNAIMFKKKIIALKSELLGDHFNRISKKYINFLQLYSVNIDRSEGNVHNKFLRFKTKKSVNFYKKYINTSLMRDKKTPSYEKINKILSKI